MGAWGTGILENDSAMDWVMLFEPNPSVAKIRETYAALEQKDIEADWESVLAAALLVSTRLKKRASGFPKELTDWIRNIDKTEYEQLLIDSQQAIQQVYDLISRYDAESEISSFIVRIRSLAKNLNYTLVKPPSYKTRLSPLKVQIKSDLIFPRWKEVFSKEEFLTSLSQQDNKLFSGIGLSLKGTYHEDLLRIVKDYLSKNPKTPVEIYTSKKKSAKEQRLQILQTVSPAQEIMMYATALNEFEELSELQNVKKLSLLGAKATEKEIQVVLKLAHLNDLTLEDCAVGDLNILLKELSTKETLTSFSYKSWYGYYENIPSTDKKYDKFRIKIPLHAYSAFFEKIKSCTLSNVALDKNFSFPEKSELLTLSLDAITFHQEISLTHLEKLKYFSCKNVVGKIIGLPASILTLDITQSQNTILSFQTKILAQLLFLRIEKLPDLQGNFDGLVPHQLRDGRLLFNASNELLTFVLNSPVLETFHTKFSTSFADICSSKTFPSMKMMDIMDIPNDSDFAWLQAFPHLEELLTGIKNHPAKYQVELIQQLRRLKKLKHLFGVGSSVPESLFEELKLPLHKPPYQWDYCQRAAVLLGME